MKIVLVNTYSKKGGAAIACSRLAEALKDEVEITGIHIDETSKIKKWMYLLRLSIEKIILTFIQKKPEYRFKFSLANTGIDISKNTYVKNADVIHLHWINNGFLSLQSLEKLAQLNKPIVWTLHDMWAFTGGCHYSGACENYKKECGNCPFLSSPSDYDYSNKIHRQKEDVFQKLNLTIVTCSNWLKELAETSSLLKGKKIVAIPNPIDINVFKPQDKDILRKKYNLPINKKILLFSAANVGDVRKGYDYLEKALILLKKNYPNLAKEVELLIIGKSSATQSQQLSYKLNETGYINDSSLMADYYALSDVFVLPSIEDNLPNTVMEAMSCGIPTVAFNVGGVSDMITHMENGYLATLYSSEELVEGIRTILEDSSIQKKYAQKSREKTILRFSYKTISDTYIDLYNSCLSAL